MHHIYSTLLFYLTLTKKEKLFKIKGILRAFVLQGSQQNNVSRFLKDSVFHLGESERRAVTQAGLVLPPPSIYIYSPNAPSRGRQAEAVNHSK